MATETGVKPGPEFEAVLVEILEAEEQGSPRSLEEWVRIHPDHASSLREFFSHREAIDGFLQRFPPPFSPGETVRYFGDYELLSEIGRGGMGVIYCARQKNLNREVALKMILGGRFSNPTDLERFRHEAQSISQLDHPGIVPLYEIGEHLGHHYFTMKRVGGGSLADRLKEGPLAPAVGAKLIATVARAVHYAHQRGLLHRDLKPANILLESGETLCPLVADFGLSKPLDGGSSPTHSGAILGTPAYMAPEQARAEKQLSTAVDVYSLGAILFETITGSAPLRGESVAQTLDWLQNRLPPSPRTLNKAVDRDLETIILKCLAKSPQDRYGSAEALAEDLDRWRKGSPILARPVGPLEQACKWAKRKPALATMAAMLVTCLITAFVGMAWLLEQTRVAQRQAQDRAEAEAHEKEKAIAAEKSAERERERAQESLYFHRVNAAYRHWQDGNLVKAEELLEGCAQSQRNWEWRHLKKLLHPEESSMEGFGFRLTLDQSRMFVFHHEQVVLWDVKAWKPLKTIPHPGMRFSPSPDGSRYALFGVRVSENGYRRELTLRVLDTETGKAIWETERLPIQAENLRTVSFSPDHHWIAVCGTQSNCAQGGEAGSTTLILDGQTGALRHTLKQGGLHAVFSPDGKTLAAYEEQMELDRSERQSPFPGAPAQDAITPSSWHWPKGEPLHFGDRLIRRDCWINLIDPITGQSMGKLTHPEGYGVAQDFTWSPDGKSLFSLQRGVTDVYDLASRKHRAKLFGHKDSATAIAFTGDPNLILTGGVDHSIKLWNIREGKPIREWKGHGRYVSSLALIDRGNTLLSGGGDHTIRRWRYHQTPGRVDRPGIDERAETISAPSFGIHTSLNEGNGVFHWALAFDDEGNQILGLDAQMGPVEVIQAVFGSVPSAQKYRISLYEAQKAHPIKVFPSAWRTNTMHHQAMKMEIRPDGRFAAACFHDQPVLLDLKHGKEHFLPFRSGSTLSFSPDGKTLTTMARPEEEAFQPHQPVEGVPTYGGPPPEIVPQNQETPAIPPRPIQDLPIVPNGLPLHLGPSSFVRFWDVETRQETGFVELKEFLCEGISHSPDGRFVAAWGRTPWRQDGQAMQSSVEIRLVDVAKRQQIHALKGSGLNHRDACFSPDGAFLTAASWDGNVYVWNTTTGQLEQTLKGHQGYVWGSCFTPDGKRILSTGNDGFLRVWDRATGEEIVGFASEGGNFSGLRFNRKGQLCGTGQDRFRIWLEQ